MTISDLFMVLAVLTAPVVAVQVSQYIERRREVRERKRNVFRTLMSTRAATLATHHVEALNNIDVEFSGKSKAEKRVMEAWRMYLDHLATDPTSQGWGNKREELFVELLQRMAECLGYDFDKSHLRNTAYFPRGYGEIDMDQYTIRKAMVSWSKGEGALPVEIRTGPTSEKTSDRDKKEGNNV